VRGVKRRKISGGVAASAWRKAAAIIGINCGGGAVGSSVGEMKKNQQAAASAAAISTRHRRNKRRMRNDSNGSISLAKATMAAVAAWHGGSEKQQHQRQR
jgi:hypothetical protein